MKFKIDADEMTDTINEIPVKFVFKGSCKKCPERESDVCYDTKCMSYNRKDERSGYWKKMNFFERLRYGLKQGIKP